MRRLWLCALLLVSAFATRCSNQGLVEGDWVGVVIHLTGRSMDVVYKVRYSADTVSIAMAVEEYGDFPFENLRVTPDSIVFDWTPSFTLDCAMARLEDNSYQGACKDPWGGFGGIVMAPPGTDLDTIELHHETIESIAGWEQPEEEAQGLVVPEIQPLAGRKIDVNGLDVYLVDQGEGRPAIVLEAGLGDNHASWESLQEMLAQNRRVVSWDRLGMGYSDRTDDSRAPDILAEELRQVLRAGGIEPPYVLVGHAEGTFTVRQFAAMFPDDVLGMLLIDPRQEGEASVWRQESETSWEKYWLSRQALFQILPEAHRKEFAAFARVIESEKLPGVTVPPTVPTVVMTSGRVAEDPAWIGESEVGREIRADLDAKLVGGDGWHIQAAGNGSYIHQEDPELVASAIEELLDAVMLSRQ